MSVDEMSVDEMSVDEMSVDEMAVDGLSLLGNLPLDTTLPMYMKGVYGIMLRCSFKTCFIQAQ
jgi:hypothetical protein